MTNYSPFNEGSVAFDPGADRIRAAMINVEQQLSAIQNVDVSGTPNPSTANLLWMTGNTTDAESVFRGLTDNDLPTVIYGRGLSNTFTGNITLNGGYNTNGFFIDFLETPFTQLTNSTVDKFQVTVSQHDAVLGNPTPEFDHQGLIYTDTLSSTITFRFTTPSSLQFQAINYSEPHTLTLKDNNQTIKSSISYILESYGKAEYSSVAGVGESLIGKVTNCDSFKCSGGNGYGSNNPTTRRFTSIQELSSLYGNESSAFDSTTGLVLSIQQEGVYFIEYKDGKTFRGTTPIGIEINGELYSTQDLTATDPNPFTTIVFLRVGDTVQPYSTNCNLNAPGEVYFKITRLMGG